MGKKKLDPAPDPDVNDYNLNIEVVSHRGAWSAADNGGTATTENSRASLLRAIELGADASECDVCLSKDGYLIVQHDGTTARCCDKNYTISSTNYVSSVDSDGLDKVKLKNGETIPLLDDFIEIIKNQPQDGHLTKLRIEIKSVSATTPALEKVFDAEIEDLCEWISFSSGMGPIVQAEYQKHSKTTKNGFLCDDLSNFDSVKNNGFNMVDCSGLTSEHTALAQSEGLYVGCWTQDSESGMKDAMLRQCYSCTTNQTVKLQTLIANLKAQKK